MFADNAVVGTGSVDTCTEAAFDTALATAQANGGGTITFNCGGPATIIFTDQKQINAPTYVVISGQDPITLSGGETTPLFYVHPLATFELHNLTITGGNANNGGAIYVEEGSLLIDSSTVAGNRGGRGGAIFDDGGVPSLQNTIVGPNTADSGANCRIAGGGSILSLGHNLYDDLTCDR